MKKTLYLLAKRTFKQLERTETLSATGSFLTMRVRPSGIVIQARREDRLMSVYDRLSQAQRERIKLYFPLSHRVPHADDRRVVLPNQG